MKMGWRSSIPKRRDECFDFFDLCKIVWDGMAWHGKGWDGVEWHRSLSFATK